MYKVAIVGAGVVGSAIASLLPSRGYELVGMINRELKKETTLKADIIFITTTDSSIASVARDLAKGGIRPGQLVIHMSGALPAAILLPAKEKGASIISIHPLQSFANKEMAVRNLPGSFFAIEGDAEAYLLAEQIVKDLNGQSFYLREEDKASYHAAACIASNYLVSLIDYSMKIFNLTGVSVNDTLPALLPLIRGTVDNIEKLGTKKALTGPIARGDINTLEKHMQAIANKDPSFLKLYNQLGQHTIKLALEKGSINNQKAEELSKLLEGE